MFDKRLRKLRKERNLTQKQVANDLGITASAVGFYENGKRSPDKETLSKLADYFNTSVDYLLGRVDFRDPLPDNFNLIPVNDDTVVKIPILGTVACGTPILAEENIIGHRLVRKESINGGTYFFLQTEGDSMINAGITPGSFILIREQEVVEDGEMAVVLLLDGCEAEATVKRVYKTDGKLVLQPDSSNPKHQTRIISSGSVRIIGKVVGVQADF